VLLKDISDGERVFIDSNIFLYAAEQAPKGFAQLPTRAMFVPTSPVDCQRIWNELANQTARLARLIRLFVLHSLTESHP